MRKDSWTQYPSLPFTVCMSQPIVSFCKPMEANQSITMHDRCRRLRAAHASYLDLRPKLLLAINIGCPRLCLPIPSFEAAPQAR